MHSKGDSMMRNLYLPAVIAISLGVAGCGAPATNINISNANMNTNMNSNMNANANFNTNTNTNSVSSVISGPEADEYQATVTMRIETIGSDKKTTLPPITAQVARSGSDRRMVFTMPAGGRVIYLDKSGTNYVVLPERNQYAEIDEESTGFEVRQMLMPEEIVERVKAAEGVRLVGEEKFNGRDATRYSYGAVADTQTQAGQVATESFLIVDKATGLPLRSEIVSQSQSGGNVQGYSGIRVITEMSDIQTTTTPADFAEPTNLQKIESQQIRAQVDALFTAAAGMIMQALNQGQQQR